MKFFLVIALVLLIAFVIAIVRFAPRCPQEGQTFGSYLVYGCSK